MSSRRANNLALRTKLLFCVFNPTDIGDMNWESQRGSLCIINPQMELFAADAESAHVAHMFQAKPFVGFLITMQRLWLL